jgi:hypothetical protein
LHGESPSTARNIRPQALWSPEGNIALTD